MGASGDQSHRKKKQVIVIITIMIIMRQTGEKINNKRERQITDHLVTWGREMPPLSFIFLMLYSLSAYYTMANDDWAEGVQTYLLCLPSSLISASI